MATPLDQLPSKDMQSDGPPIRPPPAGGSRSHASSAASKYVPDEYPIPTTTLDEPVNSNQDFLAPSAAARVHQPAPEPQGFEPARPEQYRTPPAALSPAVPPAQLHPESMPGNQGGRPHPLHHHSRRSSTASHRSGRSHTSYHSTTSGHRYDDPQQDRRRDYDEDRVEGRQQQQYHHHHHHHHHHHDDSLKRRDTHRGGFGNSLFALYDGIKEAVKGY